MKISTISTTNLILAATANLWLHRGMGYRCTRREYIMFTQHKHSPDILLFTRHHRNTEVRFESQLLLGEDFYVHSDSPPRIPFPVWITQTQYDEGPPIITPIGTFSPVILDSTTALCESTLARHRQHIELPSQFLSQDSSILLPEEWMQDFL